MENHDPKRWSFFQKLVQSDFHRKDVSLMDQDHLGFSLTNKENGAPIDYSFPPLRNEGAALGRMDAHVDYEANFQPPSSSAVGPTSMTLHPENSQFSGNQSSQFEGLVIPKSPESDIKPKVCYLSALIIFSYIVYTFVKLQVLFYYLMYFLVFRMGR